jgi:hypothetical protein
MNITLQDRLERYLSDAPGDGWVKTKHICKAFGLASDRPLRAVGDRPGLCTPFAISGDKGLKHIDRATTAEWLRFKHRIRKHGICELVRVRDLDRRRSRSTRTIKRPPFEFQKDTGQGVLL